MQWCRDVYMNIDGEYEPTPHRAYTLNIRRGYYNHSYEGKIWERLDKGYCAHAYLNIGNHAVKQILNPKEDGSYFKTVKQAEKFVNNWIREFDKSDKPNQLIEDWKYEHCKPVFDMALQYVGDEYFSANYVTNPNSREIWDYFNDNPIEYSGLYWTLCLKHGELLLLKQTCRPIMTGGEYVADESMIKTLLEKTLKIDNPYLKRYKEYAESIVEV